MERLTVNVSRDEYLDLFEGWQNFIAIPASLPGVSELTPFDCICIRFKDGTDANDYDRYRVAVLRIKLIKELKIDSSDEPVVYLAQVNCLGEYIKYTKPKNKEEEK